MSFADNLFSTEVKDLHPLSTNSISIRNQQGESKPYMHLKQVKNRAKSLEREFLEQKMQHDRVKKNVEDINHKSALKRMQFLKVYGNKKAKYHTRELLETRRQQRQKFERKSLDLVKRRKLQYELQHILLQNEEEHKIYQLQARNKNYKDIFKKELLLANQRERAYHHYEQIKKASGQFMIRKRNLRTAISLRSKKNYYTKISQQLSLIQNYENILNEVESLTRVGQIDQSKFESSTMCQTLDRGQMFITTKKTIQ